MTVAQSNKFSILLPIYYREQALYLRQALDSLLRQSLKAAEVVIIKDGPLTDSLDAELSTFDGSYPGEVRIISLEKNVGLGDALRLGLENCSYDLVARVDSDDINVVHRFEKQISFLATNTGIAVVGSAIEEFADNPGDLRQIKACPLGDRAIRRTLRFKNPFNHMSCVFRRSLVQEAGSYLPMFQYEDYYLWYRMARMGAKFANLPDVLVYARVGNDQLSRRRGWKYFKSELAFFGMMRREKFIGWMLYYANLLPRLVLRMAPKSALRCFYRVVLRASH
ncbi:MAG TPA: glycosyltransferase [Lacunisphaera sp.]|nr:glycosyltransferase [Lacunisphaera sp.]